MDVDGHWGMWRAGEASLWRGTRRIQIAGNPIKSRWTLREGTMPAKLAVVLQHMMSSTERCIRSPCMDVFVNCDSCCTCPVAHVRVRRSPLHHVILGGSRSNTSNSDQGSYFRDPNHISKDRQTGDSFVMSPAEFEWPA